MAEERREKISLVLDEVANDIKQIKSELPDTTSSPVATVADAQGSTAGFEQSILAAAGQVALTVLVVGITTTGKFQCTSLGNNNVIEIFEPNNYLVTNIVKYRVFSDLGEPLTFEGLTLGTVIVASKGLYGFSEIEGKSTAAANQGVMPAMSFGFAFTSTFLYAFRGSTGNNNDRGVITVCNGPLSSVIKLTDGSNVTIDGQEDIILAPWEVTLLDTNGNKEYILSSNNKIMAQIFSEGGGVKGSGLTGLELGTIWDCRLIPPLSSTLIGNPRSGFMSSPYDNTLVKWWRRTGTTGSFTVSPGSPFNIATTGGNLGDHNPNGYVKYKAPQITGYSGADGQGGDAVAFFDPATFSQIVAQPFFMPDGGNGDETGCLVVSEWVGTARYYQWDDATRTIALIYTLELTRGITVTTPEDQNHPCAASLSNSTGNDNNTLLVGDLLPGFWIADVPIGVVAQAQGGQMDMRNQFGDLVTSIYTQEDETSLFGWTPETKDFDGGIPYTKMVMSSREDGVKMIQVINNDNTFSWRLA